MRTATARVGILMFAAAALLSIAEVASWPTIESPGSVRSGSDGGGSEEDEEPDDSPRHSPSKLARNADSFVVPMQRVELRGNAKCMDGSRPLYYIRTNNASKKWIIFLQGGVYCFDQQSCLSRTVNSPILTSSNDMPSTWTATGILSSNPEENPLLFFANAVFLPYCSGDIWIGNSTKKAKDRKSFYFMGPAIIQEVIIDLIKKRNFGNARKLFLTGGSAGATGVLLNIDRVAALIRSQGLPGVAVYGIVDSGWFFEPETSKRQYHQEKCESVMTCPAVVTLQKGYRYWNPRLPKGCVEQHRREPWLCFFGPRVYPHIRSPVFILQYYHDNAQALAVNGWRAQENSGRSAHDRSDSSSVASISQSTKNSLKNVTALFAMSCQGHEMLTYSKWHKLKIGETNLVDAIRCWEESQEVTNRAKSRGRARGETDDRTENNRLLQDGHILEDGHRATASAPPGRGSIRSSTATVTTSPDSDAELNQMAASNRLVSSYRRHKIDECSYRTADECVTFECNPFCPSWQ